MRNSILRPLGVSLFSLAVSQLLAAVTGGKPSLILSLILLAAAIALFWVLTRRK